VNGLVLADLISFQNCAILQTQPVALEFASAWVRSLSYREIAQEIEHNLDFLTTPPNAPERHRSLRAFLTQTWLYQPAVLCKLFVF
jgi:predicted ATPase